MKTIIIRLLLILPLVGGPISGYCAERFAGRFQGEGLLFESRAGQSNYSGTITLGANAFNFTASETPEGLAGSFTTPDGPFDFKAILKGEGLTLTTGDSRYRLTRQNTNPLAKAKSTSASGEKLKKVGGGFLHHLIDSVVSGQGKFGDAAKNAALDTLVSGVEGQSGSGGATQGAGALLSGLQGQGGQVTGVLTGDSPASAPNTQPDQSASSPGVDPSVSGGQGSWPASAAPSGDAPLSGVVTQPDPSARAQPANTVANGTQGPAGQPAAPPSNTNPLSSGQAQTSAPTAIPASGTGSGQTFRAPGTQTSSNNRNPAPSTSDLAGIWTKTDRKMLDGKDHNLPTASDHKN